eukprot:96634_1
MSDKIFFPEFMIMIVNQTMNLTPEEARDKFLDMMNDWFALVRIFETIKTQLKLEGSILEMFEKIQKEQIEGTVKSILEFRTMVKAVQSNGEPIQVIKENLQLIETLTYKNTVQRLLSECPKDIQEEHWSRWTPDMYEEVGKTHFENGLSLQQFIAPKMPFTVRATPVRATPNQECCCIVQ